MQNKGYITNIPCLKNRVQFSFVAIFCESAQFVRKYTLPFNMIGIVSRCKDENSSVITNLRTGEVCKSHLNDIHLTPCGLPQLYAHTYDQEHLSIHFKLELYPGIDVFAGQDRMIVFRDAAIRKEAQEIFRLHDNILKLSRCQEIVLRICHRFWPEHYPFDMQKLKTFDDVLFYIKESANALTTIEDLAQIKHQTVSAFASDFRETFQLTPKAFLQKELFKKSALMLLNPDYSVKETAAKLKFSSEFYFSRFFKRMSGLPPKEYRDSEK